MATLNGNTPHDLLVFLREVLIDFDALIDSHSTTCHLINGKEYKLEKSSWVNPRHWGSDPFCGAEGRIRGIVKSLPDGTILIDKLTAFTRDCIKRDREPHTFRHLLTTETDALAAYLEASGKLKQPVAYATSNLDLRVDIDNRVVSRAGERYQHSEANFGDSKKDCWTMVRALVSADGEPVDMKKLLPDQSSTNRRNYISRINTELLSLDVEAESTGTQTWCLKTVTQK